MGDPVFDNGRPARISAQDFLRYHLQHFPRLSKPENAAMLDEAITTVYSMFHGVGTIWDIHEDKLVWYQKTVACYRLLVAWYMADMYPSMVAGVPVMGGVALRRKKIGPVDVTYADRRESKNPDDEDLLESLRSNPFGGKAYLMIKSSGKRKLLLGPRT